MARADYSRLRTLFNLGDWVSDDDISAALNAAGINTSSNSSSFWRDSTRDLEGEKWLDRQRILRDRINESIQREIELEEELQDLKARGAEEEEILEKRRELANQKRETENLKEAKHQDGVLSKISNTVNAIENMVRTVQRINDPWAKADAAASKYAKTIGTIGKGMDALRKSTLKNVVQSHLGINYNISTEELLGLQENYAKAVGRNIRLSNEDQENLAAINMATNGMANDLLPDFEKFGLSISASATHVGKMFSDASKEGVSLEKYTKNVQQGLAMAQTYTFRGGLKSMEAMAKRAAAIRMEMSQVSSFADHFSTIEDSIKNAARLQVLGGPFAAGADALGLLNDSLTDAESLQKRMESFTNGMGTLNKQTGEVTISAFNRQRLKEYANITGQDFNKVIEVAERQAMRGEIDAQIKSSASAVGLDDDFKELIKNTATFKDGKAGVSINGKFKTIDELEEKDREELIAQTRSESEDVKDIAKNVRSLVDIREGFGKQKDAVQAVITAPIAKLEKFLGRTLGLSNTLLGIIAGAQIIGSVAGMFRGGGRLGTNVSKWVRGRRGTGRGISSANKIRGAKDAGASFNALKGTQGLVNTFGKEGAASILRTSKSIKAAKGVGETAKALKTGTAAMSTLKLAKSSGVAAGAIEGLVTGIDEFTGNKNYGTGKKVGRTAGAAVGGGLGGWGGAALGAAIGTALLPGIGTIIGGALGGLAGGSAGGAIGKWAGGGFASQKRRDKTKERLGLTEELHGDYKVSELKEIGRARATGKISEKTLNKLADKGDIEMYQQLSAIKAEKEKEKEEKRGRKSRRTEAEENKEEAKKLTRGEFTIEHAYFGGRGIIGSSLFSGRPISNTLASFRRNSPFGVTLKGAEHLLSSLKPVKLLRGKPETGSSKELNMFETLKKAGRFVGNLAEKRVENTERLKVDIDGKIKLETNGQNIDILNLIKKNPKLLNELTEAIVKNMNVRKHGAYVEDRHSGDNYV